MDIERGLEMQIEYSFYCLNSGDCFQKPASQLEETMVLGPIPTALVCLKIDGKEKREVACGENSLDALFKAFCRTVEMEINLRAYQIRERFRSGNPLGKASVRIMIDEKEGKWHESDTDSRKAFLLALIEAVNQIQEEAENGFSNRC